MNAVISVIQWLVAELAMWFIAGLLPDRALRVLRAVGGVAMGVGVILLLLAATLAFAVEDELGTVLGFALGAIGFLVMVIGAGLRALASSDSGLDVFDVVNSV